MEKKFREILAALRKVTSEIIDTISYLLAGEGCNNAGLFAQATIWPQSLRIAQHTP